MKPHRVGIYARVSTNEQGTENQLIDLRRYAEQRGWTIFGEYLSGFTFPLMYGKDVFVESVGSQVEISRPADCPALGVNANFGEKSWFLPGFENTFAGQIRNIHLTGKPISEADEKTVTFSRFNVNDVIVHALPQGFDLIYFLLCDCLDPSSLEFPLV